MLIQCNACHAYIGVFIGFAHCGIRRSCGNMQLRLVSPSCFDVAGHLRVAELCLYASICLGRDGQALLNQVLLQVLNPQSAVQQAQAVLIQPTALPWEEVDCAGSAR